MREIPGYRWDEATKRYYKDDRRAPASTTVTKPKKQSQKHRQPESTVVLKKHGTVNLALSSGRPMFRLLDATATAPFASNIRQSLRDLAIKSTFKHLKAVATEQPNLTPGDTITCFEFDKEDSEIIRYGTSGGVIGKGRIISKLRAPGHSVDQWEMEHIMGATITSVHTSRGHMVATSLGPVAQAVFGRTDSHAHVKFAPRHTSLWSSAIYQTQVALGCDKKVLYARNPADQAFQSFGTGSAVFALDLQDSELYVGTRSGHVRFFDVRASRSREEQSAQILLRLSSAVVHIRKLKNDSFIVAQMNGALACYDARFVKNQASALVSYPGHVNTQSRGLGLDTWRDQVLAASGEDRIVRTWSILTGQLLPQAITMRRNYSVDGMMESFPIQFQPDEPYKVSLWQGEENHFIKYSDTMS